MHRPWTPTGRVLKIWCVCSCEIQEVLWQLVSSCMIAQHDVNRTTNPRKRLLFPSRGKKRRRTDLMIYHFGVFLIKKDVRCHWWLCGFAPFINKVSTIMRFCCCSAVKYGPLQTVFVLNIYKKSLDDCIVTLRLAKTEPLRTFSRLPDSQIKILASAKTASLSLHTLPLLRQSVKFSTGNSPVFAFITHCF